MDENGNSAELEAEAILKAEHEKAQAETCPQGDQCAVHFRVDEEYRDEESEYARYITYLGDYVVITDDSLEVQSPVTIIRLALGLISREDVPTYETAVYYVGEGTIGDLSDASEDAKRGAYRYTEKHSNWDEVGPRHTMVCSGLQAGLIDVSKPVLE